MNKQRLSVVFLLLMIIGIISSFYLFFQLNRTNESLARTERELMNHQNNSETRTQEQQAIIDSLVSVVDSLLSRFSIEDEGFLEQKESLENKSRHVNFFVGLYALVSNRTSFDTSLSFLHKEGYTVIANEVLSRRPEWLAPNSTVFYYDPATETLANEIAENLSAVTRLEFQVSKGAGLGVPKGKRAQYFYVHIVEN